MLRSFTLGVMLLAGCSLSSPVAARGGGGGFHGGGGGGFGGGGGGYHGGGGGGFGGAGGYHPGGAGGAGLGGYGGGAHPGGYGGYGGFGGFGGGAAGLGGGAAAGLGDRGADGAGRLGGGQFNSNFGGFASHPSAGDLNHFLGLPSDGGFNSVTHSSSVGNYTIDRGAVEGPRGGVAGGTAVVGPNGGEAARGAAVGPNGRAAAGERVTGPGGNTYGRGVAAGPNGAVGGFRYTSPSGRYAQATAVRRGYYDHNMFNRGWYADHPGAWYAAGLTAGAWAGATWASVDDWVGCDSEPVEYNYGDNVVYMDDSVDVDGQPVGTPQQYYQQSSDLAQTGAAANVSGDDQWLPLGVFAMTHGDQTESHLIIQLAVNKQGIVRGNYTDTVSNTTSIVQGAVDKETQRVSWTIGSNTQNVLETGLSNLTKDQAVVLAHFGADRTEQWLLVRLSQQQAEADGAAPTGDNAAPADAPQQQ